ncbi:MAG: sulfurtransferase TusA family protein [Wenzhouxiangellaceae bacterium]|nr:sulfurtransferase TusA family protein [Wenzhouxiangellaceae bacterium]
MDERSTNPPEYELLDATGLTCPEPVFRARRRLAGMRPGEVLEVHADDPMARLDFAVFCERTGHQLVSSRAVAGRLEIRIRKRRRAAGDGD